MILKNRLLTHVDLSSLSRALEEIILPQAGRLALAAFNVFDLSSLARALDEDIASQAARFTGAVSSAFDMSVLSLALDEDNSAKTARPIVNVFNMSPLSQALNEIRVKAARPAIPAANMFDMSLVSRALNDIATRAVRPADTVSNVFDPTLLARALDENIATQAQKVNTEQRGITRNTLLNAVTMPPVPVNILAAPIITTDPPTISASRAEKLPVHDVPAEMNRGKGVPARKTAPAEMNNGQEVSATNVDKVSRQTASSRLCRVDTTSMAGSSGVKVEDLNRRVGINAVSKTSHRSRYLSPTCHQDRSTPPLSSVTATPVEDGDKPIGSRKRKFNRAFEIYEVLPAKRQREVGGTVKFLPHIPNRKRRLSDAFKSSELPAKKRQRDDDVESSLPPALPAVNCQPVISAPVNLLPVNKRKLDDAIECSEAENFRKRRCLDAPSSDDGARSMPLAIAPLPTTPLLTTFLSFRKRKREKDSEIFAPKVTSTPVKQRADEGDDLISFEEFEAERIRVESVPELAEECNRIIFDLFTRKRKRTAGVFSENDVEKSIAERLNTLETSLENQSTSTTETEEPAVSNDKAEVIADDETEVEDNVVEDEDGAWRERYLELCREVFGDGENSDEEEGPTSTQSAA